MRKHFLSAFGYQSLTADFFESVGNFHKILKSGKDLKRYSSSINLVKSNSCVETRMPLDVLREERAARGGSATLCSL